MFLAFFLFFAQSGRADIVSTDANGQISVQTTRANDLCINSGATACGTLRAGIGVSGRVGINNTNPSTELDVTGTVTATTLTGTLTGAVTPSAVDLSTITTALALKNDITNPAQINLSTVTTALNLKADLAGANMSGQLTTTSTITVQGTGFSVGGSTTATPNGLFVVNSTGTYIRGAVDGGTVGAGYVGELLSAAGHSITSFLSASYVSVATVTLTAGEWDLSGSVLGETGGTTAATQLRVCISLTNDNCDVVTGNNTHSIPTTLTVGQSINMPVGQRRLRVTSSTPVYLTSLLVYTVLGGAFYDANSVIQARRIR